MKTQTTSTRSTTIRMAASLLACGLGLAAITAAGCLAPDDTAIEGETAEPDSPVGSAELELTSKDLGPHDRVGELRINEQILHVVDGEQQPALAALGAVPVGQGIYLHPSSGIEFTLNIVPNWSFLPQFVCSCNGYTIYKNAKCGTAAPFCAMCTNNTNGTSQYPCYNGSGSCVRGTGYCVNNNNAVIGNVYHFDNLNCVPPQLPTTNILGAACN